MVDNIVKELGLEDIGESELPRADTPFNQSLDQKASLDDTSKATGTAISNVKKALNEYKIKGKLIGDMTPRELSTRGKVWKKIILDNDDFSPSQRMNMIKIINTEFKAAEMHISDGKLTKLLKDVVGEDKYNSLTNWDKMRARKGVAIPDNFYKKMPQVIRGLTGESKNLAGIMLYGGFRPNDFANVKIENINLSEGVIRDVTIKGKSVTIVMPDMVKDIVKQQIGNKEAGFLFKVNNAGEIMSSTFTPIKEALKNAFPEKLKTYRPFAGKITENDAGLKLFRNANETLWNELEIPDKDKIRAIMTGRMSSSEAEAYGLDRTSIRKYRNASRIVLAKNIGYSGVSSVAQTIRNIGYNLTAFSNAAKRIPITAANLVDEVFTDLLSSGFIRNLDKTKKPLLDEIPVVDEKLSKLVADASDADMEEYIETKKYDAAKTKEKRLKTEEDIDKLLEDKKKIKLNQNQENLKKKINLGNISKKLAVPAMLATGFGLMPEGEAAFDPNIPADSEPEFNPTDLLFPMAFEPKSFPNEMFEMQDYNPEEYARQLRLSKIKKELGIEGGELMPQQSEEGEDLIQEEMTNLGF